jgi:phosphatidate phosphatase APP1
MVDHERGRTVVVRVGDKTVKLSKSRPDGQFFGTFHLSQDAITNRDAITLTLTAVLRTNDLRVFAGEVNLLGETGITVISDIDDTIKDTRVQDRNAALRSTFLEPFKAVPGMARVYQHWRRDSDAHFIYVSASPWQLYLPLTDFIRSEGFPPGPFYLKDFRWKDQTFFNLFQSPVKYKPKVIEPILKRFPNRRFILVGDSGESDPEIYGELARKFPVQISRILIREVTTDPGKKERYAAAFLHVPDKIWKVFDQPAEIENAIAESRQF